eukprot:4964855-Prymnesium_polylepis.2
MVSSDSSYLAVRWCRSAPGGMRGSRCECRRSEADARHAATQKRNAHSSNEPPCAPEQWQKAIGVLKPLEDCAMK